MTTTIAILKAAEASEWIEHDGKSMPVAHDTLVDVRHRDGDEFERVRAGNREDVYAVDWSHEDQDFDGDIVAYRVHSQSSKAISSAEEKQGAAS